MIKLKVEEPAVIPMTVKEEFINRGANLQANKNATAATSDVYVTPDPGYDGMEQVTIAAVPETVLGTPTWSYSDGYIGVGIPVSTPGMMTNGVGEGIAAASVLPTEAGKTVTPTTSTQVAVNANKWTIGQIKVGAIPSEYIIPSGTKSISANGTNIDVKAYEKVDVAVPGPSGTKLISVSSNGTMADVDVTNYAAARITANVPNSYAAGDEGKVVSNGALVAQTSDTVTTNGVVDTTLINSLTVNVSGGGGTDLKGIVEGTLTSLSNNDITSVRANGFQNYSALESITLPNVTSVKANAFQQCTGLTDVHLPNLTTLTGSEQFKMCSKLEVIALPKLTSSMGYVFQSCTKLKTVDLYSPSSLGTSTFASCSVFDTLILRKSSGIIALGNVNTFSGTAFKSGGTGGTIYIPKALYDHLGDGTALDYQHATNWSTVHGYGTITWAKIEGSIYETQYADGTPIT